MDVNNLSSWFVVYLHITENFPAFLLLLAPSFISLQVGEILHAISVFLNLPRLVWDLICDLPWWMLCALEETYVLLLLGGMIRLRPLGPTGLMCSSLQGFHVDFCRGHLSIDERGGNCSPHYDCIAVYFSL